jgi:hypothetical protein
VVKGTTTGVVAGLVMLLFFLLVWVLLPLRLMGRQGRSSSAP